MAETTVRLYPDKVAAMLRSDMIARDLTKRAIQVEAAAKRLCPVDKGRLRASVTHSIERDSRGLIAFVGSNVHYAIYQELGTRHMRAQPYLRPALRAAR
jgi:HK97 gp10 family phage protein